MSATRVLLGFITEKTGRPTDSRAVHLYGSDGLSRLYQLLPFRTVKTLITQNQIEHYFGFGRDLFHWERNNK